MRLGVVTHSTAIWGAESTLLTLMSAVLERDPTWRIDLLSPPGELASAWTSGGFGVWTSLETRGSLSGPSGALRTIPQTIRQIERSFSHHDVVHSHHQWTHPALAISRLEALKVCDLHDVPPTRIGKRIQALAGRRMDRIFVASDLTAGVLGKRLRATSVRLPRPVSLSGTRRPGPVSATSGLTLSIAARPDTWKQVPEAVRAVLPMLSDGDRIVVAGGTAEQYGLGDLTQSTHIEFMGKLSRQATLDMISSSDLYLLTAPFEPFGRVAVEAAAVGVPTIAFRSAGVASDIDRLGVGWLIDDFTQLAPILAGVRAGEAVPQRTLAAFAAQFQPSAVAELYRATIMEPVRSSHTQDSR